MSRPSMETLANRRMSKPSKETLEAIGNNKNVKEIR